MVKVINIQDSYIPLLFHLYPQYSFLTEFIKYNRFIIKHDVASMGDMNRVKSIYDECIIISSRLYDELWDEEKLQSLFLEKSHRLSGSKKRTLSIPYDDKDSFVTALVYFLYTGEYSEQQEERITNLFSIYGSLSFNVEYLKLSNSIPSTKLFASMMTFITKLFTDSTSTFYKKKYMLLSGKIRNNLNNALSSYCRESADPFVQLKFLNDLIK
nr:MAG TPA: hypothetical protein [Caudoviricetes sp.]